MAKRKVEEPIRSEEHLEDLRTRLIQKRAELADFYAHDVRVGKESNDESSDDIGDRANNSYNRELMFSLSDGERKRLIEIDEAFGRDERRCSGPISNCPVQDGRPTPTFLD